MLFKKPISPPAAARPDDFMTALTVREILAATNLEHYARQLAIKGEPPLEHPGLTPAENDALELFERRNTARTTDFDAQAQALAQQLQLLTSTSHEVDPAILQHRTVDALTEIVTARAPAIRETLSTERTRVAERAAWRDEHEVARLAEYPKSRLVHFRWVGVAGAGETAAESTLLLSATPDGLMGAFGIALGVTIVTTGLGLLIGFFGLRYISASSTAKRLAAWLSLPALGSALLAVSLYVAHYRHVAGAANDTPNDAQVIEHLIAQPFDLTGPGWLLLILSLACAAFAAWKGYTASDPIPGYEKVDRAYVDARDDHDYLRTDLQAAIAGVKSKTIKPLIEQPRLTRLKRDHLHGLAAELENKREQIGRLAKQEAELVQRAIGHFRRLNLATRADGVTPAYFSELPVVATVEPKLPTGLLERVTTVTGSAVANAQKAADLALQIARMLDHASDRADAIMISVDQARPRDGDNPVLELRAVLQATLDAAALPSPEPKGAIPAPEPAVGKA
jgi:hypothetical protein